MTYKETIADLDRLFTELTTTHFVASATGVNEDRLSRLAYLSGAATAAINQAFEAAGKASDEAGKASIN